MERTLYCDHNTLINELTQGMEKTKQLKYHLLSTSPNEAHDLLLQRILSSYEKALTILNPNRSDDKRRRRAVGSEASLTAAHESSITVDVSPRSDDTYTSFRDSQEHSSITRKRKLQPTWTQQVKVNFENGLEGPTDDGFSWRKYGQKDILGAKYPRSYYRCTYKSLQNCWATKQIQRSDQDPSVFEITYKGTHTCSQSNTIVHQPSALSEETEQGHSCHSYQMNQTQEQKQTLMNSKDDLRVSIADSSEKNEHITAAVDQFSFLWQDGENYHYFPTSAANVGENYMGNYDLPEIISTHASTTNSPIGAFELATDSIEIDSEFLFGYNMGFFS